MHIYTGSFDYVIIFTVTKERAWICRAQVQLITPPPLCLLGVRYLIRVSWGIARVSWNTSFLMTRVSWGMTLCALNMEELLHKHGLRWKTYYSLWAWHIVTWPEQLLDRYCNAGRFTLSSSVLAKLMWDIQAEILVESCQFTRISNY